MGYSFALGNRNKRSLGLNLRSDTGKELFGRLVANSDVVLTNFKPGTLESLGLGYDTLSAINPRIILVESSALGRTGPWSRRMGYGPLVRATVGLTTLWRHPDAPDGFGDDQTVYPDHAAARVGAAGVVAALVERRTYRGGTTDRLGPDGDGVLRSWPPSTFASRCSRAPWLRRVTAANSTRPAGVYACTGEDAYCAVTVDGDDDWVNLAKVIGRPDLAGQARVRDVRRSVSPTVRNSMRYCRSGSRP